MQPQVTWIIVLIFVGISSFSLAALLYLLVADKWSSYVLQRQQTSHGFTLTRFLGEKTGNVLPTHIEHGASWSIGQFSRAKDFLALITPHVDFPWTKQPEDPKTQVPVKYNTSSPNPEPPPAVHPHTPSMPSPSSVRERWRLAIKKVIVLSHATQPNSESSKQDDDLMMSLESRLRNITETDRIIHHETGSDTSDIQCHPDGTSLAICGKRLSMRWEIGVSMQ